MIFNLSKLNELNDNNKTPTKLWFHCPNCRIKLTMLPRQLNEPQKYQCSYCETVYATKLGDYKNLYELKDNRYYTKNKISLRNSSEVDIRRREIFGSDPAIHDKCSHYNERSICSICSVVNKMMDWSK